MKSKLSNVQIDISVVMPIYNSSKYLEETLKSVLEQKKINLELICVDDGSTDNSIEIIKSKAQQDPRVKLLSQDHLGAGVARNVGLKESKGQFIAFMDSDDLYPSENTLSNMFELAIKHKVSICGGSLLNIIGSKVIKEECLREEMCFHSSRILSYENYQYLFGFTRFIYNNKFLQDNNITFPNYFRGEDPPFLVKAMICAKEFYAMESATYLYRVGYKATHWVKENIMGSLKYMYDCLKMSVEHKLTKLQKYTSNVFVDYVYRVIKLEELQDNEIYLKAKSFLPFLKNEDKNIKDFFITLLNFDNYSEYLERISREKDSNNYIPKIVVWGIKDEFITIRNSLYLESIKGNLQVIGYCSKKDNDTPDEIDCISVYESKDLIKIDFDYIVIANKGSFDVIKSTAQDILNQKAMQSQKDNLKQIRILSYKPFTMPGFNFKEFICHNQN